MRSGSTLLKQLLHGSFDFRWLADVFLDGNRIVQDVPLLAPQFVDDATSLVQGTGNVQIAYSGDFADSIAPSKVGDALSPFGTQLWVYVLVTVGDGFQERIPFGHYLIAEAPSIESTKYTLNGVIVTKGDLISLELKDLFLGVQRDRFDTPGSAPSLTSVWTEVQRLTQLPVTRAIADGAISTSVAYQEDKLQAVYDLAQQLDAIAMMTADGTVSMRPNIWPAAVDTLKSAQIDPEGTLVSLGKAMANDQVYNKVVIRDNAADGTAILATAEVTSGPLRTQNPGGSLSPYRRVPYYYSSPYITTQAQAAALAPTLLTRVSQLRGLNIPIVETFNPLRDLGDVLTISRLGESYTGRVTRIERGNAGTQKTTVQVSP